jgi:hypothetical protein
MNQCGAGLAVTGRIRDIGQNALQSAFEQEVAAALVISKGCKTLLFSSKFPQAGDSVLRNLWTILASALKNGSPALV